MTCVDSTEIEPLLEELRHVCVESMNSREAKAVNHKYKPELVRKEEKSLKPLSFTLLILLVRVNLIKVDDYVSKFITLPFLCKFFFWLLLFENLFVNLA